MDSLDSRGILILNHEVINRPRRFTLMLLVPKPLERVTTPEELDPLLKKVIEVLVVWTL